MRYLIIIMLLLSSCVSNRPIFMYDQEVKFYDYKNGRYTYTTGKYKYEDKSGTFAIMLSDSTMMHIPYELIVLEWCY